MLNRKNRLPAQRFNHFKSKSQRMTVGNLTNISDCKIHINKLSLHMKTDSRQQLTHRNL